MPFDRNTRIICTMGPATDDLESIRSLIVRGMNVARFNFSHGNHQEHARRMALVRAASAAEGIPVGLLLDTKGPEIRTGALQQVQTLRLEKDAALVVMSEADATQAYGPEAAEPTAERLTISYRGLADDVVPGAKILIADGLVSLLVQSVEGREIRCKVLDGGEFGSRKNVNVLGVHTKLPALGEQDRDDLRFGAEQGVDFIAASFIRKASDVTSIQKFLASIHSDLPIIAKIEDEEGLDNVEEILRVASGIMVARGDLGVQVPAERVPLEQKRIIALCNAVGKPVVTATQMLESMIKNPRPTRAEAGDVANAILDGTDCVMLSGETANGAYPAEAVETMARIAKVVESSSEYARLLDERRAARASESDIAEAIAQAASETADRIDAAAIVVPTISGNSARMVSRHRPRRRIVAGVPNEAVRRRLLVYWGIVPVAMERQTDSEAMIQGAIAVALKEGYVKPLDKVVVVAGLPIASPLQTNSVRVHVIGNVLARGGRGFGGRCTGRVVKARTLDDAARSLSKRDAEVLVTHTLDESFIPILRLVDGVILEGVSEMPWELVRAANPRLVYVSQVAHAMERIEENLTVTLDGAEKLIYEGIL